MRKQYWKGAPEWANAVIVSKCGNEYYVSQWGGISARQLVGSDTADNDNSADMIYPHEWTLVETRQATWDGTGMPPAGTVCEVDGTSGPDGWSKCIIKYSSQDVIVFSRIGSDVEHARYSGEANFLPIRTPEQIAAEQRNAAQKAIQDLILSCFKIDKITAAGIAGVVADADYRKFEIVPE